MHIHDKVVLFYIDYQKVYVLSPYLPHMFSITSWLACFSFAFLLLWLLQCRKLLCHSLLSWGISLCIGIHCCVFYIFCGVGQCTLDMSQIQDVISRSLPSIFGSSAAKRRHRCLPPSLLWLHGHGRVCGDAVEVLIGVERALSYICCMLSIIRILDALFCNNSKCWKSCNPSN